jgi:hypothetical protein
MPTLNWIGKEAVVNHHHQVPFHLLKDVPELSVGDPGSGNLIVQGDNLVALKAPCPVNVNELDELERRVLFSVNGCHTSKRSLCSRLTAQIRKIPAKQGIAYHYKPLCQ